MNTSSPEALALIAGLVILAGQGAVKFLFGRYVKTGDDEQSRQRDVNHKVNGHLENLRIGIVGLEARMKRVEEELSNDKQGRAAVVGMQTQMAALVEAVDGMREQMKEVRTDVRDAFSRINSLSERGRHLPAAE